MAVTSHRIPITRQKIIEAFSKAALRYDEFSGLQKEIGLRLLEEIEIKKGVFFVLDIGIGTGWLTEKLVQHFPQAKITGIDFAPGMIECAKERKCKFKIVQADACALPFKNDTFDMVISNLTYQWIANLWGAFGLVYKVLKKGGMFYLSSFGKRTLQELFISLDIAIDRKNGNVIFTPKRLADKEDIEKALLENGFYDIQVRTEIMKIHFTDMPSLMRWLKRIGATGMKHDIFIGRELLVRADDFYKRNFSDHNKIFASFEIVWGEAKK